MTKKKAHLISYKHRRLGARPPPSFTCETCGRALSTGESLKRHMRAMHSTRTENVINNEFECHLCRKVLQNKNTLKRHIKVIHCLEKTREFGPFIELVFP